VKKAQWIKLIEKTRDMVVQLKKEEATLTCETLMIEAGQASTLPALKGMEPNINQMPEVLSDKSHE
jgi:hypothetical protein